MFHQILAQELLYFIPSFGCQKLCFRSKTSIFNFQYKNCFPCFLKLFLINLHTPICDNMAMPSEKISVDFRADQIHQGQIISLNKPNLSTLPVEVLVKIVRYLITDTSRDFHSHFDGYFIFFFLSCIHGDLTTILLIPLLLNLLCV